MQENDIRERETDIGRVTTYKNILWFDVSVYNLVGMEIDESHSQLSCSSGSIHFTEVLAVKDGIKQVTSLKHTQWTLSILCMIVLMFQPGQESQNYVIDSQLLSLYRIIVYGQNYNTLTIVS